MGGGWNWDWHECHILATSFRRQLVDFTKVCVYYSLSLSTLVCSAKPDRSDSLFSGLQHVRCHFYAEYVSILNILLEFVILNLFGNIVSEQLPRNTIRKSC